MARPLHHDLSLDRFATERSLLRIEHIVRDIAEEFIRNATVKSFSLLSRDLAFDSVPRKFRVSGLVSTATIDGTS